MEDAIRQLNEQFRWQPIVMHAEELPERVHKYVLAGMGGSHLAADLLRRVRTGLDFHLHEDYGVPQLRGESPEEHLLIASSYSGNTEEVVSFLEEAIARELSVAVIAVGGELLALAQQHNLPYVQLPDTGIQPRNALGYTLRALAALIDDSELLQKTARLADIDFGYLEDQGKDFAHTLQNKIPVIYASRTNETLAYNWKIKMNETGKSPAFYNVFPELNHNELESFNVARLREQFHVIFLYDEYDHERVQKRMKITEQLYREKGMATTWLPLEGSTLMERIFKSLTLADWTAVQLAHVYGQDPEKVNTIELFKKRLNK